MESLEDCRIEIAQCVQFEPILLRRTLFIIFTVLQRCRNEEFSPHSPLREWLPMVILPSIAHTEPLVREMALCSLALFCLRDVVCDDCFNVCQ